VGKKWGDKVTKLFQIRKNQESQNLKKPRRCAVFIGLKMGWNIGGARDGQRTSSIEAGLSGSCVFWGVGLKKPGISRAGVWPF